MSAELMILTLPVPVKGCAHAVITQVTLDLAQRVAFVRVRFGSSDDGTTFEPDEDLAERCCVFEAGQFEALYSALDATPVVVALNERAWAARVEIPPEVTEPEPEPEQPQTLPPEEES